MTAPSAFDNSEASLRTVQGLVHRSCFVCSASNPAGLSVRYVPQPDGSVCASFLGHSQLEGYPGLLHGGVIAALLDGAMTNCLFAQNHRALTAEMNVRYRAGVTSTDELLVCAHVESSRHGFFRLHAEIVQGGVVKASASGKFIEKRG